MIASKSDFSSVSLCLSVKYQLPILCTPQVKFRDLLQDKKGESVPDIDVNEVM